MERLKIVRFRLNGQSTYGALVGQTIHALEGEPWSPVGVGKAIAALEEVELLTPCQPTKIVAVGRNYAAHAAEHGSEVPQEPLLFLKPPSAVIGPGQAIRYPDHLSQWVEHEAELALVVGRRARRVRPREALGFVLGYTCGNDVTARDLQRSDAQWTRAKGFDTFCPLGPWIVTDLDVSDLSIRCWVNDSLRQEGRTSEMVFGVAELLSYASAVMTLEPGDVLMSGTPAGVGPLHPGDRVVVEIEGIGKLENGVAPWTSC